MTEPAKHFTLLVSGLCLSRNLGGPAMALTLVEQVRKRFPGAGFVFAVETEEYSHEKKWADIYGLEIVRRDTFVENFINTNPMLRLARFFYRVLRRQSLAPASDRLKRQVHREFMEAYRRCDAVIGMRGISYIGDGVRGALEGAASYSNLYYARKWKKPFAHFVQSFGPFTDWRVRYFARRDFRQVDFIPARGRESARLCREIVDNPDKVYDFPDIAILLKPAAGDWTMQYLREKGLAAGAYTVLSPSAVIRQLRPSVGGSVGQAHVESFALIAMRLLAGGDNLLFLPHMFSDNPRHCDRQVCYQVLALLRQKGHDTGRCRVVEEELTPNQAKALIASSRRAVVSRYHALVAAASTQVPVVPVGWNIKYADLLEYYGLEATALDVRRYQPEALAGLVQQKLAEYEGFDYKSMMQARHRENVARVERAFDLLSDWIRRHAG